MKKRSDDQWRELVNEFKGSGLSQTAFCRQQRICKTRFSEHRKRLELESTTFIQALPFRESTRQNTTFQLRYENTTLELQDCSVSTLVSIMKQLA